MVGDVEMEEFAPVMSEDDEDEEETKGEGGDDKEVDGDHLAEVSRQKGPPRQGGCGDVRHMYFATVSSATS